MASRLEMSPPGLGGVSIETAHALADRMGFWLPTHPDRERLERLQERAHSQRSS